MFDYHTIVLWDNNQELKDIIIKEYDYSIVAMKELYVSSEERRVKLDQVLYYPVATPELQRSLSSKGN